uniref:Uncharacterized protein n=1 Tax=Siphoviridae sp. ct5FX1 TaxID=2825335 RepID=A0A8S5UPW8_9CAUD|nr:MAG TPA: hypothetical protein [Siphoviridae sp. ct5FX1]
MGAVVDRPIEERVSKEHPVFRMLFTCSKLI